GSRGAEGSQEAPGRGQVVGLRGPGADAGLPGGPGERPQGAPVRLRLLPAGLGPARGEARRERRGGGGGECGAAGPRLGEWGRAGGGCGCGGGRGGGGVEGAGWPAGGAPARHAYEVAYHLPGIVPGDDRVAWELRNDRVARELRIDPAALYDPRDAHMAAEA